MKKNLKRLMAFSLSAVLVLTGCGQKQEASTEEQTQTTGIERLVNKEEIRFASRVVDGNFDPCNGWGYQGTSLFHSVLMKNTNMQLEYDLATEYSISEDGLTWTFKIRDDVKFHDGEKLTAHDVAFTYNNTKAIAGRVDLTTMNEAVAIDDTTVEFRMNTPFSAFLYYTGALGIVPEHAYTDSATYSKNPIGSGPLKFVQFDEGQQLIMERNDDYYGKVPNFKRVIMLMMDADSAFAAVKAGEADVAITNQSLGLSAIDGYRTETFETIDYRVISFPVSKAEGATTEQGDPIGNDVTSDEAIRKALSIGLNRENIVNNALNGFAEITLDVFNKLPWGLGDQVSVLKDNQKDEANKILDEAGWVVGADGIREKDGVKAEFELMYGASAFDRQAIALAVAEDAKDLGISVKPVGLDWSEIEMRAKSTPMVLGGGEYLPMNISRMFNSKFANQTGWNNVAGYSNPKTDAYIQAAIEATTEEAALENWKKVQWDGEFGPSALGSNVYLPVCYLQHLFFVRDGVTLGNNIILPHDHGTGVMGDVVNWDYNAN